MNQWQATLFTYSRYYVYQLQIHMYACMKSVTLHNGVFPLLTRIYCDMTYESDIKINRGKRSQCAFGYLETNLNFSSSSGSSFCYHIWIVHSTSEWLYACWRCSSKCWLLRPLCLKVGNLACRFGLRKLASSPVAAVRVAVHGAALQAGYTSSVRSMGRKFS